MTEDEINLLICQTLTPNDAPGTRYTQYLEEAWAAFEWIHAHLADVETVEKWQRRIGPRQNLYVVLGICGARRVKPQSYCEIRFSYDHEPDGSMLTAHADTPARAICLCFVKVHHFIKTGEELQP